MDELFANATEVDMFEDLTAEEKQEAIEEALREIAEHNRCEGLETLSQLLSRENHAKITR